MRIQQYTFTKSIFEVTGVRVCVQGNPSKQEEADQSKDHLNIEQHSWLICCSILEIFLYGWMKLVQTEEISCASLGML